MPLDKKQERTLSKLWNNGRETAISQNTHDLDNSSFQLLLVNNECNGQAAHFATIMTQLYQLDNFERLEQATTDSNNLSDFSDLNVEAQWWQVPDFAESLLEMIPLAMGGSIYYSEYDALHPPCPAIALGTCADVVDSDPCVAAMVADPNSGITLKTPWLIVNIMKWPDPDPDVDPTGTGSDCCTIIDGGIIIIDPPSGGWSGGGVSLPPGSHPPVHDGGPPNGGGVLGGDYPTHVDIDCDSNPIVAHDGTNTTKTLPDVIDSGNIFLDFLIAAGVQSLIPFIPVLDVADSDTKTAIDTAIATWGGLPAHCTIIEVTLGYYWVSMWDAKISIPLPLVGTQVFNLKKDRLPPAIAFYRGGSTTTDDRRLLKPNKIFNVGEGKARVDTVPFNYGMTVATAEKWEHLQIPEYDKLTAISLNGLLYPAIGLADSFNSEPITDSPVIELALCGITYDQRFIGYWLEGTENSFTSDPNVTHKNFDFLAALYSGDRWPTIDSGAIESDVDEILLEVVANPSTFSISGGHGPGIYMQSGSPETDSNVIAWGSAGTSGTQIATADDTTSKWRWWIKVPSSPRDEIWYRSTYGREYTIRVVGVHQVSSGLRFVEGDKVTYPSKPVVVN